MLQDLRTEVFYPYPPERIWQVLTSHRALSAWLMDNDFEPRLGHKFQFQNKSLPGVNGTICCEIIELDEPKRLSYTWQDRWMHQPSVVTWTLKPVDGGTRLHLEHRGLKHKISKFSQPRYLGNQWQGHLMHQPTAGTLTLEAVAGSTPFPPNQTGFERHLESVILSSYLNGGWNHLLNNRFQQTLAHAATDAMAFS